MTTRQKGSWVAATTATNAAAAASRTAPTGGLRHFITSVAGTYETTGTSGTLTLTDGTTSVVWHVHDAFAVVFPSPIELKAGASATLTLAASGTAGVDGAATLTGYTL